MDERYRIAARQLKELEKEFFRWRDEYGDKEHAFSVIIPQIRAMAESLPRHVLDDYITQQGYSKDPNKAGIVGWALLNRDAPPTEEQSRNIQAERADEFSGTGDLYKGTTDYLDKEGNNILNANGKPIGRVHVGERFKFGEGGQHYADEAQQNYAKDAKDAADIDALEAESKSDEAPSQVGTAQEGLKNDEVPQDDTEGTGGRKFGYGIGAFGAVAKNIAKHARTFATGYSNAAEEERQKWLADHPEQAKAFEEEAQKDTDDQLAGVRGWFQGDSTARGEKLGHFLGGLKNNILRGDENFMSGFRGENEGYGRMGKFGRGVGAAMEGAKNAAERFAEGAKFGYDKNNYEGGNWDDQNYSENLNRHREALKTGWGNWRNNLAGLSGRAVGEGARAADAGVRHAGNSALNFASGLTGGEAYGRAGRAGRATKEFGEHAVGSAYNFGKGLAGSDEAYGRAGRYGRNVRDFGSAVKDRLVQAGKWGWRQGRGLVKGVGEGYRDWS